MCTLSVQVRGDGFIATMNRDETFRRAPEIPPERTESSSGVVWAAPRDGERGGTWMGVNCFGVTACLLNAYRPGESLLPDTSGRFRSRGEIIPKLLEAGHSSDARAWVRDELDHEAYPSFTLICVTPTDRFSYEWLRDESPTLIDLDSPWILRSSSGWDSDRVARWREDRFAEWITNGCETRGPLPAFHVLREPGHEDRSPLMRRLWAETRSITQVEVRPKGGDVFLRYWPQPTEMSSEPAHECQIAFCPSPEVADAEAT